MAKPVLDIAVEIARLESLAIDELRKEWRRLYQTPPPKRLSRDILLRGITYKLQEKAFGGLSKATLRKLHGSVARGQASDRKRRPRVSFKPGTRLVREWHGADAYGCHPGRWGRMAGPTLRSLSVVAREITGARWSGPRFFGLKTGAMASRPGRRPRESHSPNP